MKMKGSTPTIVLFFTMALLALSNGCQRFSLYQDDDATLNFSTDTLAFDTVFTTRGSATRLFKVFNPYRQSIEISEIRLAGGASSSFRINVDGNPGHVFEGQTIAPRDSMYIFAEVTVDPNNVNNPFVIKDSVEFVTNGNVQDVKLTAYGQNAHFHNNEIICNETWTNDKPHVIVGLAAVDSNCTLTIREGTRIYAGKGNYLLVAGTLRVLGTKDSVVSFEGDRLESFFDDLPGQWRGLIFSRSSKNNLIRHADINEAITGINNGSTIAPIRSPSDYDNEFVDFNKPDVTLEQVTIRNTQEHGIFNIYADLQATNCLFHSNGLNSVELTMGGDHRLTHCTIANYGATGIDHKDPALRISNYDVRFESLFIRPYEGRFENSIIFGNIALDTSDRSGELSIDMIDTLAPLEYFFDHALVRTNMAMADPGHFNSITTNANPLFEDTGEDKYELTENSPAIDAGDPAYAPPLDIKGRSRSGVPDLGAFEFQP